MIATTAPVIWPIALRVASTGESFSSDMMRSTFSMTTIASSTTMPIASTMPNSVSWLIVKPMIHMPRNVPSSATGITSVGMIVARKFCRKISMTRKTSTIASISVLTTSLIEIFTNVVESYGVNQVTPAGKRRLQLVHLRAHEVGDLQRIRAGQQLDRERAGRLAVPLRVEAVGERAERDARDVLEAHRRAVRIRAQDDVLELLGRAEAAFGRDGRGEALRRQRRLAADRARRELHVLRAHGGRAPRVADRP